jgi:hypothetical protein
MLTVDPRELEEMLDRAEAHEPIADWPADGFLLGIALGCLEGRQARLS